MTRTRLPSFLLAAMSLLVLAPQAYAGMPTVRLSDIASLRIQTISFFLLLTLVSAWGTKGLWNGLVRDFPGWPKLTYRGALFGTVLWGLLFLVVLTMISGARELMTPGAWEEGRTHIPTRSRSRGGSAASSRSKYSDERRAATEPRYSPLCSLVACGHTRIRIPRVTGNGPVRGGVLATTR